MAGDRVNSAAGELAMGIVGADDEQTVAEPPDSNRHAAERRPVAQQVETRVRVAGERNRAPQLATVAAADIGAIDPDGRSAGTISGARPR